MHFLLIIQFIQIYFHYYYFFAIQKKMSKVLLTKDQLMAHLVRKYY
jgi:hypothetical protein